MNFFKDIKAFSLPWSTRLFVVVVLAFACAANLALFSFSLWAGRHDLLAATVQFFGVLLPVLLIVTVLARADSGVNGLKRRTEMLFTHVLPPILANLVETPHGFYAPDRRRRPPAGQALTPVFVNLRRGECQAEIALAAPADIDGTPGWRLMVLRLEVTVARINFNLCIPADRDAAGTSADCADLMGRFHHTLEGAGVTGPADADGRAQTGWNFLKTGVSRCIEGRRHLCLVGGKFVSRDFLWDSAEQLYFAQDLMFMLRAFLAEAPDCFLVIAGQAAPGADDVRAALRSSDEARATTAA